MYRGTREDVQRFVRRQTDIDQDGAPDRGTAGRRRLETIAREALEDSWDQFQGIARVDLSPGSAHEGSVALGPIQGTELDNGIYGAPSAGCASRQD